MTLSRLTETASPVSDSSSGVTLRLIPDTLEVPLLADQRGELPTGRLSRVYHKVVPPPSMLVTVTGLDDRSRRLLLSVRAANVFSSGPTRTSGFAPHWARFSFERRVVPELEGGAAVGEQDQLQDEDRRLQLLVRPGERREASLEFVVSVESGAAPGDYLFVVEAEEDGVTVATATGLLELRAPESRLLHMLPALYQDAMRSERQMLDTGQTPFFERMLLGMEAARAPVEALVAEMSRLFSPTTTPPELTRWLGTWVALSLDENMPELKRRRLIGEATELYRWRGTKRGLSRYIEIYTGIRPRIEDQPVTGMRLGSETRLGRNALLGNIAPHTFVVTLPTPPGQPTLSEQTMQAVRDIIAADKPAHTACELRIVHALPAPLDSLPDGEPETPTVNVTDQIAVAGNEE